MFTQNGVPLSVSYGTIDRLFITIPWNDMKNKATRIEIENVFILCNPGILCFIVAEAPFDPYKENIAEQEKKQKNLKMLESELQEKEQGYFHNIGEAVVDNLQITIKNIHIRYEDSTSSVFYINIVSFWSRSNFK
jgi:vacuolar protein sorting-associated protein 13A/C